MFLQHVPTLLIVGHLGLETVIFESSPRAALPSKEPEHVGAVAGSHRKGSVAGAHFAHLFLCFFSADDGCAGLPATLFFCRDKPVEWA